MEQKRKLRLDVIKTIDEYLQYEPDIKYHVLIARLVRKFGEDPAYFDRLIDLFVRSEEYVINVVDNVRYLSLPMQKITDHADSILLAKPATKGGN